MPENKEADSDMEAILDSCALDCMQAIESKDKNKFKAAFEVLVADVVNRLSSDESSDA